MTQFNFQQRRLGVLLHPTSLPSGTLEDAYRWIDFMDQSGLTVWQVLPFGIPQGGLSPYQSLSAFAINPALMGHLPAGGGDLEGERFREFCDRQHYWLDDFALYMIIKTKFSQKPWFEWPRQYRDREPQLMKSVQDHNSQEISNIKWQQYYLSFCWQQILDYCRDRDIHIFGDMAIFVAHDSADVWAHQSLFLLDAKGQPAVVTGVPPDYFSETGQRWGNPHFNWEEMERDGFKWWLERFFHNFEWFELMRIDHFCGFETVWMINAASRTAEDGYWQKVPGGRLLTVLYDEMARLNIVLPLVAEDLGIITDEVRALKNSYHLPGMAVLQFSFDELGDNPHKPANIKEETVVYTGTHDNDTTLGWFNSLTPDTRQYVLSYLGLDNDEEIVEKMIETTLLTDATLAVIPLQDFLCLDSAARMNRPGTVNGNWLWRFNWEQIDTPRLDVEIRRLCEQTNRCHTGDVNSSAK